MKKNIFVLCFLLIIVVLLGVGCTKKEIAVTLLSPEDGATITESNLTIEGMIRGKRVKQLFYQIEDGYTLLGSGEVTVDRKGYFETEIIMTDPKPHSSRPYLELRFYLEKNNDGNVVGQFNPETKIASFSLTYEGSN